MDPFDLLDRWRQFPVWVRVPVSLGVLGAALGLMWWLVDGSWGFAADAAVLPGALFAIGLVLLFAGPSESNKRGYHD
jgi:hypothetical protein